MFLYLEGGQTIPLQDLYFWYLRGGYCFSRMRSEGFPFIVGGLGVGAVFAWLASCRRLSSSSRLKFAAIGGSFCK